MEENLAVQTANMVDQLVRIIGLATIDAVVHAGVYTTFALAAYVLIRRAK